MQNINIHHATSTMIIPASRTVVWEKVGFYEHVKKSPSWLLRVALPVPEQVEGRHSHVGDLCRCRYSDGGYLTKRITNIAILSRIEFEIVEQSIRFQDTVKLLGGCIELQDAENSHTLITMTTHYKNQIAPRAISSLFINRVIKSMHRFVMRDMCIQLSIVEFPQPENAHV